LTLGRILVSVDPTESSTQSRVPIFKNGSGIGGTVNGPWGVLLPGSLLGFNFFLLPPNKYCRRLGLVFPRGIGSHPTTENVLEENSNGVWDVDDQAQGTRNRKYQQAQ